MTAKLLNDAFLLGLAEIGRVKRLVEVELESLAALRDKFKVDWPTHISAFSLIDTFIRRFDKNPKSRETVKIYSLNGNWESYGTFVAKMVREKQNILRTFFILILSVLARERSFFRNLRSEFS